VTFGLGMVTGNLINGKVTAHYALAEAVEGVTYNWPRIWMVPAVMAIIVFILFAVLFRENANTNSEPVQDIQDS
jgi:MFS family permease